MRTIALLLSSLAFSGCTSSQASPATAPSSPAPLPDTSAAVQGVPELAPTCAPPVEANTLDGGWGCQAFPFDHFSFCGVSSGAVILPDGGVADGTETCRSQCTPDQYAVLCQAPEGEWQADPGNYPPAPARSLGCQGAGGPGPDNEEIYCCPCGP